MKKRQRRKLNQQRAKRTEQNRRFQERAAAIRQSQREAFAKFEIDVFPPENLKFTPFETGVCYFCDSPIGGEVVASEKVFALVSKKSGKVYATHLEHVYEPDGETPVAEMKNNLTELYLKIFEAEEGHNFKTEAENA